MIVRIVNPMIMAAVWGVEDGRRWRWSSEEKVGRSWTSLEKMTSGVGYPEGPPHLPRAILDVLPSHHPSNSQRTLQILTWSSFWRDFGRSRRTNLVAIVTAKRREKNRPSLLIVWSGRPSSAIYHIFQTTSFSGTKKQNGICLETEKLHSS